MQIKFLQKRSIETKTSKFIITIKHMFSTSSIDNHKPGSCNPITNLKKLTRNKSSKKKFQGKKITIIASVVITVIWSINAAKISAH